MLGADGVRHARGTAKHRPVLARRGSTVRSADILSGRRHDDDQS